MEALNSTNQVPRGEKMLDSGTNPESYIIEYTLVYEDKSCQNGPNNMTSGAVWISKAWRDWYFIAKQSAPAPHLERPEARAALTHMC